MLVPEKHINRVINLFDTGELNAEKVLDHIFDKHESLFQYCHSGILDPLPDDDRAFFFFLLAVVMKSLEEVLGNDLILSIQSILDAEENNWALFNDQKGPFRARLDAFYTDYPEEDLLSFAEDSLDVEESENLSLASRELIFITIKSIIDSVLSDS